MMDEQRRLSHIRAGQDRPSALDLDYDNLTVSSGDDYETDGSEIVGQPTFFQSFPRGPGQRPLIDYVTNNWESSQSRRRTSSSSSSGSSDFGGPRWLRTLCSIICAPKFRRYLIVYIILVISFFIGWSVILRPEIEEGASLVRALDVETMKQVGGWFGSNTRPEFSEIVSMRSLDPALLPSYEGSKKLTTRRRLIIVGDVHGCKDELEQLLRKVSFDREAGDHLVFTGDLINKGPDSAGVVDIARGLQASCVRGNHEDRILLLRSQMKNDGTFEKLEGDVKSPIAAHRKVAKELSDAQALWLQQCPVILNIGEVKGMGDVVVVHGGLVPGVTLSRQDLPSVMTMRTIDLESHVPSERTNGVPWSKLYNTYQELLLKQIKKSKDGVYGGLSRTTTVIYGHDAASSLNIQKYTKGLDSGCVYGRKLSALVIEDGGKNKVVQVKCKQYVDS